jgi:putative Ca2+/H+ antiporter (TMEM165/GDT1 family)
MSVPSEQKSVTSTSTSDIRTFWAIFGSTFLTIFLAEMGDKTQLATLLMTAQSRSPWVVFAGAALALAATSILGLDCSSLVTTAVKSWGCPVVIGDRSRTG